MSPDGDQVAFSWNGEKLGKTDKPPGADDFDIYLKLVGSSDLRRLTTDSGRTWAGGWSPDGRQIAWFRDFPQGVIYLLSPASGAQHKLIDFPAFGRPVWSPDGKWLIAAGQPRAPEGNGIYVIPVDGGPPRRVLQPKAPQVLVSPALAPDGHHLAYMACRTPSGGPKCEVEVMESTSGGSRSQCRVA